MNAKDYLLQIQTYDSQIENTLYDIAHWKDVAMNITSHLKDEKVQSSGTKQKMEAAICKYIDAELEIVDVLFEKRKEIINTIATLKANEYNLLHKMYVQNKDLSVAAIEMDKSYRWATSVHDRALANVQKMLDEREQNE